ncbi:MAG: hypothetical protein NXY57DRAFT_1028891 [Lentinula lateritia]|uniref:DUF6534 domain-containing protein n=1 Tax=Lentinula lateritia TaxID=40482 RepID=A0ABQ8V2R7_9AGAR|nr:MAG: hypothetical protein NXY57DRAFT_1028891 [Lentinula lateritia]KAJ4471179.1 hypothetical protein C8R41DRAFT_851061 [Lentinula lateritia]
MPPAPPQPPTVIQVYTPFFVGTFLNIFLYGVAVTQMYTYYRTSASDKLWMKLLVLYLFVLDTVNSFCDIGLLFEPLLLDFGNQDVVATSPWTLRLDGISTALISTPVQIFMAWRIKIIMETIIPTVIISILAISSLTGSIWLAIAVSNTPQYAKFDDFRAAPSLWLISSAIADIAIACCLVYGLSKKRTGFAVLNDQIDRIIRVTVQTGSLTALTALIDVIVFLSVPDTTIFFAWDLALSKLYTTTLLSSLNSRASARNADRNKVNEPNALFSSETSSHLTFNQQNARVSRYNPTTQAPKNTNGFSEDHYELSSRPQSPPRRERDRLGFRDPAPPTDFNVLVSRSTISDNPDDAIYPPSKNVTP